MEPIVLLSQTKTAAAIEIIIMLVVAVVIGYLTSWLYYRSVYTRKINLLEKEKDTLKSRIVGLEADKGDLQKKLEKVNEELNKLKEKTIKRKQEG